MSVGPFGKQSIARPELNSQVGFVCWLACLVFSRTCLSIRNHVNVPGARMVMSTWCPITFYGGCNNSELGLINEGIKQQQQ